MGQVLAVRAEGWSPQEDKGVHAALKQGLHGPQQPHPGICTCTTLLWFTVQRCVTA